MDDLTKLIADGYTKTCLDWTIQEEPIFKLPEGEEAIGMQIFEGDLYILTSGNLYIAKQQFKERECKCPACGKRYILTKNHMHKRYLSDAFKDPTCSECQKKGIIAKEEITNDRWVYKDPPPTALL